MVLYEFPFNESMRTMLRLERLFDRLGVLLARDSAIDHHYALVTMFEVADVASRADLKSDLLKDMERHKAQFASLRDNPAVQQEALAELIGKLDAAFESLNRQSGKPGQAFAQEEWLSALRSRLAIPGGTCEFDLPAYHAWLQGDAPRRREALMGWIAQLAPLAEALRLLLQLVRDSGVPRKVTTQRGIFQQSLTQSRTPQLARLRLDPALELVPEITGHRLLVGVRLMRMDAERRLKPAGVDADFELALCH